MSRNLLEKILKNEFNFNLDKIIDFFVKYNKNDYIYPSVVKRNLKLEDEDVYKIMNILEKAKLVKMYYEIYCYKCDRTSNLCESFGQLEEYLICNNCESEMDINYNVKITYKVVE